MNRLVTGTVCVFAALALSGCPGGNRDETFEIWLINTSDAVTIVNTTVTDDANTDVQSEFPEDLPPQTARVIDDISTEDFAGDTVTIGLAGEDKGLVGGDPDATVSVPETIQDGTVLVIVASGDGGLSAFTAEYVPLDASSKGRQLLDHMVTQQL